MFLRNHKEKYPIHPFLAEVTRGGWRVEGFADVFLSVLLSLKLASVLSKKESTGADKIIGTPDTVQSVHTHPVHHNIIKHRCLTTRLRRCIIKHNANTETTRCGRQKPHQCIIKNAPKHKPTGAFVGISIDVTINNVH